ncbi:putative bifunctional diguanylate cyclase/phosphodiesterase [Roseibium sp.]|uniref:putative bifunctional diguanylate cyclase/phosphodiesterase n=1 Tax=Roseibium sp. TaxID=1936156 RepID=UPI003B52D5C0
MSNSIVKFSRSSTDTLFPLQVMVSECGRITELGPTLQKVLGPGVVGCDFFDVFKIERPRNVGCMRSLRKRTGVRLLIAVLPEYGEGLQFRGVAVATCTGIFFDLSFGMHIRQMVQRFHLTESDFKPNDFTIDLIYSLEAQKTLLEDSEKLASALKAAKEEAERRALEDPLTGIGNRAALHNHLSKILHTPGTPSRFALLHIDLDDFKAVNDNFGHAAGDQVLVHTASVLNRYSGPRDLPVRIGGDEFALVLSDVYDQSALNETAHELLEEISRPVYYLGHACRVGASIGVVQFNRCEKLDVERLISNSDIALYNAKITKSAVQFLSPEMVARHDESVRLVSEIESGIHSNQFVPFFQPLIDIETGKVAALEVLARWDTSETLALLPAHFLETANQAAIMPAIDKQVRKKAFAQFASWLEQGFDVGKLSLNMTASALRSSEFVSVFLDELSQAGLSPERIQLELVEAILFDNRDKDLIAQCNVLQNYGITLALDDFGTGHSSIASLIEPPVSVLKIDRSFITGVTDSPKMQKIARAMIEMAGTMEFVVVAEGIETEDELVFLKNCGCRLFQGFHLSPPRKAEDLERWMASRNTKVLSSTGS